MSHNKRESKLTSLYENKLNILKINYQEILISLRFYKDVSKTTSRFYNRLKRKYPEIYKEIRDECIEVYGKPKTKKEFCIEEINKMNDSSKKVGLKKKLLRRFKLDGSNAKGVKK